jgi:hypothetical protein
MRLVVRIRVVLRPLSQLLGNDEFVQGYLTLIHLLSHLQATRFCSLRHGNRLKPLLGVFLLTSPDGFCHSLLPGKFSSVPRVLPAQQWEAKQLSRLSKFSCIQNPCIYFGLFGAVAYFSLNIFAPSDQMMIFKHPKQARCLERRFMGLAGSFGQIYFLVFSYMSHSFIIFRGRIHRLCSGL